MTSEERKTMEMISEAKKRYKDIEKNTPSGNSNDQVKATAEGNKKLTRKQYKHLAKQALEMALANAITLGNEKMNPENEFLEEKESMSPEEIEATVTVLETFLAVLKKRTYI